MAATATATVSATDSATTTVTATPMISDTATPLLTATPTISVTATPTLTATPTITATPTATATNTQTPTATLTPTPASTATPTPIPTLPIAWTWTQLAAANPPPARQDATVVWDSSDHELLVYGGSSSGTNGLNDLWAYNVGVGTRAWTQLASSLDAGRFGASGVWDSVGQRLLIFGGQIGTGASASFFNDVQAYSPGSQSWSVLSAQGAPGAPLARSRTSAAWDSSLGRLVIFGGETFDGAPGPPPVPPTLNADLWAFSPSSATWSLLDAGSAAGEPPTREWAAAAWDTTANTLRLFGGKNTASSILSDTWEWSASSGWRFDDARTQPDGRGAGAAAWDSTHNRFLVGPGLNLTGEANDTWAYDPASTTWLHQYITSAAPPLRQMTGMAWDDLDGQALLFGGRISGPGPANDLWALAPMAPLVTPTPTATLGPTQKALDVGRVVDDNGTVLVTPAEVTAVAQAGASLVRFSFDLGGSQTWTSTLLQRYGQAITMFQNAGIGVIGLVSNGATDDNNQADWTANNSEHTGGNGDNAFISSAYVPALETLVSHFHGPPYNVKLWELWNEPNAYHSCTPDNYCSGGSFIYPSNFAALLADSYQQIKVTDVYSDVTLISGGLFGHSIGGAYTSNNAGATYLTSTYQQGIAHAWPTVLATAHTYPLDAVGQHIYIDQSQYSTPATIHTYQDWLRGAYTAYEGAATTKHTVVTEAGWNTGGTGVACVAPIQQATNVDALYWATRAVTYSPIVTWFQLQDNPAANLYFGLYDVAGTPKPSLARYQTLPNTPLTAAGVIAPCAPPTETPPPAPTFTTIPPTPTSTSTPSPTATATPAPPISTPTHTPAPPTRIPAPPPPPPTATPAPTDTPAPPTAMPRPTPKPTPLRVQAPSKVASGGTLAVAIHTASHARATVAVQVTTTKVVVTGKGRHRKRTVQTIVLYRAQAQGQADKHGSITLRLKITYKPATPGRAALSVTARTPRGAVTRTSYLTILPPPYTPPLSVQVTPSAVIGGNRLAVHVRSVPRAQIGVTLQVTTTTVTLTGKDKHRRRSVRTLLLYKEQAQGKADTHGAFTAHIIVRYEPTKATHATLSVTARTPRGAATHALTITIRPRPTHKH